MPTADHEISQLAARSVALNEELTQLNREIGELSTEARDKFDLKVSELSTALRAGALPDGFTLVGGTFEVSWHNLEKLIKSEYRQKYSIVASEEWSNDTEHLFEPVGGVDDPDAIEEFRRTGSGNYILADIFEDLVARGVLIAGRYLVKVSW